MGCVRLKVLKVEIHSRATPSGRGDQSSQSTRWSASISDRRVKKRTHWLKGLVLSVWKCTSTKHLNQRSGESCGCQRDYRYPDAPSWWADETWCNLGVVSTEVLMMADEVECDSGENSLEQSLVYQSGNVHRPSDRRCSRSRDPHWENPQQCRSIGSDQSVKKSESDH